MHYYGIFYRHSREREKLFLNQLLFSILISVTHKYSASCKKVGGVSFCGWDYVLFCAVRYRINRLINQHQISSRESRTESRR